MGSPCGCSAEWIRVHKFNNSHLDLDLTSVVSWICWSSKSPQTVIVHHWIWIILMVCHVGVCCWGRLIIYGLKRSLLLHFSCLVVVPLCCVLHLWILIQLIFHSLTLYKWIWNKLYHNQYPSVFKNKIKKESKKITSSSVFARWAYGHPAKYTNFKENSFGNNLITKSLAK